MTCPPTQWQTPSLCHDWRVRDVAAHLTLAQMGALPAMGALLRARGNLDRMIRDTAVRQARLPTGEYAGLLRAMIGSRKKAPGITDLEPLIDVLVHGQDIALPLDRARPMPAPAAAAAATRAWSMGRPFHAERKLTGLRLAATDHPWQAGQGPGGRGADRRDPAADHRTARRPEPAVRPRDGRPPRAALSQSGLTRVLPECGDLPPSWSPHPAASSVNDCSAAAAVTEVDSNLSKLIIEYRLGAAGNVIPPG